MAHDIFVSHASIDKPIADAVCAVLEKSALRCWIAPRDVQPGRSYAGEITRAIQGSRAMVLIFSGQSNGSDQVLREVQLAVDAHLHIIQFRIENVRLNDDLRFLLSTPHWLDALTPPLERHIEQLATSLKVLLGEAGPTAQVQETPTSHLAAPSSPRSTWRKVLLPVLGALVAAGVLFFALTRSNPWMTSAQYQKSFEAHMAKGFYPTLVAGRFNAGREEFRAEWQPGPAPCGYASHHGMTKEVFDRVDAQYSANGLVVASKSIFTTGGPSGVEKYTVLWKDCQPKGFTYDYKNDVDPGVRVWTRNGATWAERHPSGKIKTLKIISRSTVSGSEGTVVQPIDDGGLIVFIPDRTSSGRTLMARRDGGAWYVLGQINDVQ